MKPNFLFIYFLFVSISDNVYDQPFKEAYPPVTASTPGPPTSALPRKSPQPVTVITPIPGKMTQSSTSMAVSKAVDSVLQTSFPSKHGKLNKTPIIWSLQQESIYKNKHFVLPSLEV